MCLICLTLMWMESALGLCLGCQIHGLLVRRGWTVSGADVCLECAVGAREPGRTRRVHPNAPGLSSVPDDGAGGARARL